MNFLELTQKRFSARKFTAEPVSQDATGSIGLQQTTLEIHYCA